ncbi:hypothetical protein F2Q70_00026799 [Brassica cretica]|uniref:Non-haem dioxygenase N-terminal domain-containing protein n=1 Tax=Brassica cretica TaxID=69181 RepID=A0A8S9LBG3_BRACR|nr:hypothetical protein F2Q70_00026799 [Brassica cretica]
MGFSKDASCRADWLRVLLGWMGRKHVVSNINDVVTRCVEPVRCVGVCWLGVAASWSGFDAKVLNNQPSNIPSEYVWSDEDKPSTDIKELQVPILDISSFLSGQDNHVATSQASRLVSEAAKLHGFFLVTNHGVQEGILARAYKCMGTFFDLPASEKQKAKRKWGEISGYADSFAGRFYSELPWTETLTFRFSAEEKLRSGTETVKDLRF